MQTIVKLLKKSKNIAIFSHKGPDPDAVGSALAFRHALLKMGKSVSLFCDDEIVGNFGFLDGFEDYNKSELGEFDLYISVDVASSELLGKYQDVFSNKQNTIKIDHHEKGTNFAKHNVVKKYSACAILIFELLKALKVKITDKIATCLYLGICGDTGIFKNNNTDSKTFAVCGLIWRSLSLRATYTVPL